jgi:hypothetical protein
VETSILVRNDEVVLSDVAEGGTCVGRWNGDFRRLGIAGKMKITKPVISLFDRARLTGHITGHVSVYQSTGVT